MCCCCNGRNECERRVVSIGKVRPGQEKGMNPSGPAGLGGLAGWLATGAVGVGLRSLAYHSVHSVPLLTWLFAAVVAVSRQSVHL